MIVSGFHLPNFPIRNPIFSSLGIFVFLGITFQNYGIVFSLTWLVSVSIFYFFKNSDFKFTPLCFTEENL